MMVISYARKTDCWVKDRKKYISVWNRGRKVRGPSSLSPTRGKEGSAVSSPSVRSRKGVGEGRGANELSGPKLRDLLILVVSIKREKERRSEVPKSYYSLGVA